ENANVLRKIGVINAARLQVEHLGRQQPCQSDRSWRADNNLGKFFPLNVIKDSKDRRKAQLLQLVFRQLEFADRFEILDWDVAAADLLNEFFEKSKRELLGHHVSHEKCAPLRFADCVQSLGEFRFYFRSRKITGKLLPKRNVCRLEQFENLSGQHSLSGQTRF